MRMPGSRLATRRALALLVLVLVLCAAALAPGGAHVAVGDDGHDHHHEHHGHGHGGHEGHEGHEGHSHGGHEDHGHEGHSHGHEDHGHKEHRHGGSEGHGHGLQAAFSYAQEALAGYSLQTKAAGATLLVTLGGNAVILAFIRLDLTTAQLNVMVAFAVGGLLGDVFLHLIPHALEAQAQAQATSAGGHAHGHDHGHDHAHEHEHDLTVGLAVLGGILCFFVIEKLLRLAGGAGGHGHSHGHQDAAARKKKDDDAKEIEPSIQTPLVLGLRPGAILNMAADTVHNFTDGMALAAAFQAGDAVGLTMTIAVLVHEVPHEVGDFSVLIAQGFSKWGALRAQFLSAIGAMAGCYFGIAVSSSEPAVVLAFTAGGFIYISLVSIVPDLLAEPATLANTFLQTLAACCGIYMMIVIADLEAATHAH